MSKFSSTSDVTRVTDINMEFIQNFIETASEADIAWIEATFNKCRADEVARILSACPNMDAKEVSKRADRQYFGTFRSKFAREFYPELFVVKKKPCAKENALMVAINNRRVALNATA